MRFHFRPQSVLLVLLLPSLLLAEPEDADIAELTHDITSYHKGRQKTEEDIGKLSKMLIEYGPESEIARRGAELESRESELAFQRTTLEARRKATQEQIALLQNKVDKALSDDPLLEALDDHLEDVRKLGEAGRGPGTVEIQLRVQIAERREEVADRAGRAIIQRLNADLVDMVIREAELEAQAHHLAQQRKELEPAMKLARSLELMRQQLHWVNGEMNRLHRELQNAKAAERE